MPSLSRTDYEVAVTQLSGVELRMAADPTQLSIVRAVAADIAMRQDFDLDSIEDLKLAVDETCSTLITLAAQDAVLSCHFAVDDKGAVHIAAKISAKSAAGPDEASFGWRVLTALVDSVQTRVEETEGFLVHINLVKSTAGAVDA
ncbi:serine/threonine-protein kinase RsbW [Lentzea flaviverrucosa]|uniref:Serine/threonine-protein kinase RsbW n=1 Tax=Lentzea flaviverrucosa TaxID=200379 RepID=A0A1H9XVG1_9PSEU|nr:serine/threonine-protein kinase RsbW [Lentzea flaviverrucosa]SES50172.1 serine/threonine-protein kinase RsbW [Lentzea flaviverrucosa]